MRKLEVKILDERIRGMLPHYATPGAAGLDLRACIDAPLELGAGDSQLVSSGIAIHVADAGYSFVSDEEAIHATSVHRYDARRRTMVAENSIVSPTRSELEAKHGWAWARDIWADMFS